MKEIEGVIRKVDNTLEECRDFLSVVASHVFNHILLRDPCFKFAGVTGHVPKKSSGNSATPVGGHVRMLLEKFSCDDDEESDEQPPAMP
ncbi:hypothetical protein D1007_29407 [Hordeum vulgare]|nr:hypothetical protein D1007_29407 [Hordeum vulgare]